MRGYGVLAYVVGLAVLGLVLALMGALPTGG